MSNLVPNDGYYLVLRRFMLPPYNLSGVELHVYCVIYGFSKSGGGEFKGTVSYLAELIGVTERSVLRALTSLIKKQLLIKTVESVNNMIVSRYRVNLNFSNNT